MVKPFIVLILCLFLDLLIVACAAPVPIPTSRSTASITTTPTWVCGDAALDAIVWEDANGNGLEDNDENTFYNVCVLAIMSGTYDKAALDEMCNSRRNRTDTEGRWSTGILYAICGSNDVGKCNSYRILVVPPTDYEVTTPNPVNGCVPTSFGLKRLPTPMPTQ